MGHYIASVRDIEFNLFEVLNLGGVLDSGNYGDLDVETARTMIDEVARLAQGPVAESFAAADRHPPVFDPEAHTITVPAELAKSVQAVKDAETMMWRNRLRAPTRPWRIASTIYSCRSSRVSAPSGHTRS